MPHVIHVLRKFVPSEWGGIESHLLGLIGALDRLGWSSEVHAPLEAGTDGTPLVEAGARFRTFRGRYPCLRLGPEERERLAKSGGNLVAMGELWRLLRQRRASILHVHTLRRLGGVVRTAARLARLPYAVTIHSPVRSGTVPTAPQQARRAPIDVGAPFGLLVGAHRVVRDADLVFALNEPERAAWAGERRDRHLERLSLGIDARPAAPADRAQARRLVAGLGDARFVAMVARVDPIKGHDVAIDAFARAAPPDMHLVLAGASMDDGYAAEVRRRAAGLGPRVHFLGNLAPRLARALLAEATLALIPSRFEAFGLTLLEAWAEGTPALFADVGGMRDTAAAAGADFGRVVGHEPEQWATRLAQVLGDGDGLRRERAAAVRRVGERFSLNIVAQQIADGYRRATLGWWPT